jgi:GT2 family glycosyltransferase
MNILNALSRLYENAEGVLFVDDDVRLGDNFVPRFMAVVNKYNADIAAPALSKKSYWSHVITRQHERCKARRTSFIEVGPVVFIRKEFLKTLLPFPEIAKMGWGVDILWSHKAMQNNNIMLIVDSVPIEHNYRTIGSTYSTNDAENEMSTLLAEHELTMPTPKTLKIYR